MNQAIVIFEWKRPRYFQVCEQSLAKCNGIETWDRILCLDGNSHSTQFFTVTPPSWGFCVPHKHVGNLWHVTRSIQFAFEKGYERILFSDGDMIFRSDALEPSYSKDQADELFVSLHSHEPKRHAWMSPSGNVLYAKDAEPLLRYVQDKKWVGKPRPGFSEQTLGESYPGYDAVYCRYMLDHGMVSRYSDRSYIGHIGACGVDFNHVAIERAMFDGPTDTWLANAVRLFNTGESDVFQPRDFVYA